MTDLTPAPTLPGDGEVTMLTTEEWKAACSNLLARVGLTYEELEAKAHQGTLTPRETKTWYMVRRFEADRVPARPHLDISSRATRGASPTPNGPPEHWDPGDSHCTACGGSGLVGDQERRAAHIPQPIRFEST